MEKAGRREGADRKVANGSSVVAEGRERVGVLPRPVRLEAAGVREGQGGSRRPIVRKTAGGHRHAIGAAQADELDPILDQAYEIVGVSLVPAHRLNAPAPQGHDTRIASRLTVDAV